MGAQAKKNAKGRKKKIIIALLEAGAYRAFYELLSERDKKIGREDHNLFDIVAGTSIGSMNAAVLVSYVKENKSWHGSAEKLIEFPP